MPSLVPGGAPVPATAFTAFRTLLDGIDAAGDAPAAPNPTQGEFTTVESELHDAQTQTEGLDRAVAAARSQALAIFAELEALRRAGQHAGRRAAQPTRRRSRARLGRRIPTAWVGAAPIVLDDALAECPADDIDATRIEVVDAVERAQLVFLTGDPATLAWASQLPSEAAAVVQPARPVATTSPSGR